MNRNWAVVGCLVAVGALNACGSEERPKFSPPAATGGGATGGTGGAGGAGGAGGLAGNGSGGAAGTPTQCPNVNILTPENGATLSLTDDLDSDCSNGFQSTVQIATSAPDGTSTVLFANNQQVAQGTVTASTASFAGVQLDAAGMQILTVQVGADPACKGQASITTACSNIECSISKPILSLMHPALNGVLASKGGDRVSADGAPYQVSVEVSTNLASGAQVLLSVDDSPQGIAATVSGGKAVFPGVGLQSDGPHTVQASCVAPTGAKGTSAKVTLPVDTMAPALVVSGVSNGQYFGPNTDADANVAGLQVRACILATGDALNLPAGLGAGQQNVCVAIGGATPQCAAAVTDGVATGMNGGCVNVTCPGGAPFDLNVSLSDAPGNLSTAKVTGVSCASTLPSVQIVDPTTGINSDVSKHILAATSVQTRKDISGADLGAQYNVVACTDEAGATASLYANTIGSPRLAIGQATAVPAQAEGCPNGLGNALHFNAVTLPESLVLADGNLDKATELSVEVTAASRAVGTSPNVQVWVDSVLPVILPFQPADLCTKHIQSAVDVLQTIQLTATAAPVNLTVNRNGTPESFSAATLTTGRATFTNVALAVGTNTLTGMVSKPSGNSSALQAPCVVTVGNPPALQWLTPVAGQKLNLTSDSEPAAGWQGTLSAQTDVGPGVPITFKAGTNIVATVNTDASGKATTGVVTIGDAASVDLSAETPDVATRGIGTAVLSALRVDTQAPDAIASVQLSVQDRRGTTFRLGFTAPGDSGQNVASYQVRYSFAAIDSLAKFNAATSFNYIGTPAVAAQPDSIDVSNLYIERDYYFAAAPVDAGGNVGGFTAAGPIKALFNSIVLTTGAADDRERVIAGPVDIDGDGYGDLLIGVFNGNAAYIYWGGVNGYSLTPDITISGTPNTLFGASVAVVGNVDNDAMGYPEIAVGAPTDSGTGRVFVFKGRSKSEWRALTTLTTSTAPVPTSVSVNTVGEAKFSNANFGIALAPLGDFDGDGSPDFAIGAHRYDTNKGFVSVVYGANTVRATTFGNVTLPTDYGDGKALGISGDTAAGFFGQSLLGLGKLFPTGQTLVAGAHGASKVYAFQGRAGAALPITVAGADDTSIGTAGRNYGLALSILGSSGGVPTLGVGAPNLAGLAGSASINLGTTNGPFKGSIVSYTSSKSTTNGDGFGIAVIGNAYSGSSSTASVISSTEPDVILGSVKEGGVIGSTLYFLDGKKPFSGGDIVGLADTSYKLPSDWLGVSRFSTSGVLSAANGVTTTAIVIGEYKAGTGYQGRVLVLW